jgi:hypothetical protein
MLDAVDETVETACALSRGEESREAQIPPAKQEHGAFPPC